MLLLCTDLAIVLNILSVMVWDCHGLTNTTVNWENSFSMWNTLGPLILLLIVYLLLLLWLLLHHWDVR